MPPPKGCKPNNPKGRPKGKPNKATMETRAWIQQLVSNNREQLEKDLKSLDAGQKWTIFERLLQYTTPKMQSISVEEQVKSEYAELRNLLKTTPDEFVNAIAEKVVELKKMSKSK